MAKTKGGLDIGAHPFGVSNFVGAGTMATAFAVAFCKSNTPQYYINHNKGKIPT